VKPLELISVIAIATAGIALGLWIVLEIATWVYRRRVICEMRGHPIQWLGRCRCGAQSRRARKNSRLRIPPDIDVPTFMRNGPAERERAAADNLAVVARRLAEMGRDGPPRYPTEYGDL
jgi:hypothetical protein